MKQYTLEEKRNMPTPFNKGMTIKDFYHLCSIIGILDYSQEIIEDIIKYDSLNVGQIADISASGMVCANIYADEKEIDRIIKLIYNKDGE